MQVLSANKLNADIIEVRVLTSSDKICCQSVDIMLTFCLLDYFFKNNIQNIPKVFLKINK